MGFRDWFEGVVLILAFLFVVGVPCAFISVLGSRMINDLGNFPTKSAQIQLAASWKIFLVEIITFVLFVLCFAFLFNK